MRRTLRHALCALPLLGAFAACSQDTARTAGPPRVLATTNLVADTARRLGGAEVAVEALMGPGVDPHLYKPSESDVRRLSEADLILYNGLHLEGKMADLLERLSHDRPATAVAAVIPASELRAPPEFKGQPDPHVWFDVAMWSKTVDSVAEALTRVAPAHAATFAERARAYRAELAELDTWVHGRVAEIPAERRVLVTAHDAFGYFGRAYGVEVIGLQGISTLSEAGLADVERVVDLVASRRIPAIFVESSVPRRSIEAVQAAVRSKGGAVEIGGQLYSDSLGPADGPAGTYPGMVRANVDTIVSALAGGGP